MTRVLLAVALVVAVAAMFERGPFAADQHGDARDGGADAPSVTAPGDVPLLDGVPDGAVPAIVASITDGDTLRVALDGREERVRLLALDTPELTGECGAQRATTALTRLAPVGSQVWMEADVEDRDRYGRLLRYLWRDDGLLVNRALVRRGWARAKLYPPNDGRWPVIRRAGELAQARDAGLWRRCGWTDETAALADLPGTGRPGSCDPNYTGCVPAYPPDVDCDRVAGPVTVLGSDPHHLDGDGDRRACEPLPE